MAENRSRFRAWERFMTIILFTALALFAIYLLSAGFGWLAVKNICSVLCIILCGFGLWNLYSALEMFKPRSLWLTYGFAGLALCTIVSLLCNFPRP